MKKKQYIIPEMDVVMIKSQQLLAGSPDLGGDYGGGGILGREDENDEFIKQLLEL